MTCLQSQSWQGDRAEAEQSSRLLRKNTVLHHMVPAPSVGNLHAQEVAEESATRQGQPECGGAMEVWGRAAGLSLRNQFQGAVLEKEGRWAPRSREACGFYGRKPRGQFWGPKVGHFHEHTVTS